MPEVTTGRLQGCELEQIGHYLFGPRWQTPLALALNRSTRLVRLWRSCDRPISRICREKIEILLVRKADDRALRVNADYLYLVSSLSDSKVKMRLLELRRDLVTLRLDDRLRRAAIDLPVLPIAAAATPDYAPHDLPSVACVACPLYEHYHPILQKPVKSVPLVAKITPVGELETAVGS